MSTEALPSAWPILTTFPLLLATTSTIELSSHSGLPAAAATCSSSSSSSSGMRQRRMGAGEEECGIRREDMKEAEQAMGEAKAEEDTMVRST